MRSKTVFFFLFIICAGWAIVQIYPLTWMFYSSFKTNQEIISNMMALPARLHFNNWVDIWWGGWGSAYFGKYMRNSFIVTGLALLLTLLFAYPAGYGLARYRSRLNSTIGVVLLGTMCVPMHMIVIPLYVMLSRYGMAETYMGLIFPYTATSLPFATILTRAYFVSYPREIEDAARMDGCSDLGVFVRVVVPGSKIIFATLMVIVFPGFWNEYMLANVILTDNELRTLPVGVSMFQGAFLTEWNYTFAAISMATIPALLIYFFFQRHIVKGMALGAVKG